MPVRSPARRLGARGRSRPAALRLVPPLAGLVVLLSACGEGQGGPSGPVELGGQAEGDVTPTAPAASAQQVVDGADNQFSPADPTLTAASDGTYTLTVTVPDDSDIHTFQSDTAKFNSGPVGPGETKTVTFRAAPGTYDFYCLYHFRDGMRGTLTLR